MRKGSQASAVFGNENDIEQWKSVELWLIKRKIKGKRGVEYRLAHHEILSGTERRRTWDELVCGRANIGSLRRALSVEDQKVIEISDRAMSDLLVALGDAIYRNKVKCPREMSAKDWRHNLRIARKQVRGKRFENIADVYAAIIPKIKVDSRKARQIPCGYCHTPMLFGFVIGGRKITRRKRFCSDACKMARKRRKNS
jgi:hypothetical protein